MCPKIQISINRLINSNLSDFEEFAKVEVEVSKVQTAGGKQNQKIFF